MMRLIDANELLERMKTIENFSNQKGMFAVARKMIEDAPTVDAVEVVQCKDCRWGRKVCGNIECIADMYVLPEYHGYGWFCPNGEREENETN